MSMDANPIDVHRASDAVLAQLDQLAMKYPKLLFIATSNFLMAINGAFLPEVDQIVTIDLPASDACQNIVEDTLTALSTKFQKINALIVHKEIINIGKHYVGLDGRFRKRFLQNNSISQSRQSIYR
jgi:hypothetical protein